MDKLIIGVLFVCGILVGLGVWRVHERDEAGAVCKVQCLAEAETAYEWYEWVNGRCFCSIDQRVVEVKP